MVQHEKTRIALEQSGVFMWEYNREDWTVTRITNHLAELKIPPRCENLTELLIENGVLAPSSVSVMRDFRERIVGGAQVCDVDVELRGSQGVSQWIRIHYEVIASEGETDIAIGCGRDVTSEVLARQAYEAQISQLETANRKYFLREARADLKADYILDYHVDGEMIIQKAPVTYSGLVVAISDICVSDSDRSQVKMNLSREVLLEDYRVGESVGSAEYRIYMNNGVVRWVHTDVTLATSPGSDHVQALICTRDMTEQRQSAAMVERITTMSYLNLGLIDVNADTVVYQGGRTQQLHTRPFEGKSFDEMAAAQINRIVMPKDRDEALQALTSANIENKLAEKETYSFMFDARVHGKTVHLKWDFMYLDDTKSFIMFLCADVTDAFRAQLDQAEKLQKALDEAKRATNAKTIFLAQMSHDIRTPLNAILGSAELMRENPEKAGEFADTIHNAGTYLLGLINDILDVSKAESDGLSLTIKPAYASEFVDSIQSVIKPMMDEKNITFEIKMNCGVDLALLDKRRLNQLFYNLLSNAAKYTPEGGHVTFEAVSLGMQGKYDMTRFTVKDDGIGMSRDFQKDLFVPFSREHASDMDSFEWKGTGLGLTIVKRIVDAMGGTISVESETGKGSTFTVDLPIEPLEDDGTYRVHDIKPAVDSESLKGIHVLVAEDNSINAQIARQLFENRGMTVTVVGNGREAVETFRGSTPGQFDIIMLDLQMPVMGGLEAARALRALSREDARRIPIVAMTANAFEEDRQAAFAAGMTEHVAKPFDADEVFGIIAKSCKR